MSRPLVAALALAVLGKTVTTELALLNPARTRNPHRGAHTPGGSSAGSAAAVAAGMVPATVGSQTASSSSGRRRSAASMASSPRSGSSRALAC